MALVHLNGSFSSLERAVFFDTDEATALKLNYDDMIVFSGTLSSAQRFLGCAVFLKDVTVHQ